jgi:hypothetical protein
MIVTEEEWNIAPFESTIWTTNISLDLMNKDGGENILERWSFLSEASFMKETQYDDVNDSVRSNTIVFYIVDNRLRRRIRSFTAVVMLVLGYQWNRDDLIDKLIQLDRVQKSLQVEILERLITYVSLIQIIKYLWFI